MKTTLKFLSPKEDKRCIRSQNLFRFHCWFLILFCWCTISSNAQSPLDAAVSFTDNEGFFKVVVADTNNVSEIEVMVGSDDNPAELFSHVFSYDQSSGLPSGLSYSRSANEIILGMGTVTLLNAYNAKARLKDGSGNWSSWYEFIGN